MSRKPYDIPLVRYREKPVSSDPTSIGSHMHQTLRDTLFSLYRRAVSISDRRAGLPVDGFLGAGFMVVPTDPISGSVIVKAGLGFQYDATADSGLVTNVEQIAGLDDLSPFKPLVLTEDQTISLAAQPAAGTTRIDIIEVRYSRELDDDSTRLLFTTPQNDFLPGLTKKTLSYSADSLVDSVVTPADSTSPIGYKIGAAALTGTEQPPPTTSGYIKIAEIVVRNATDNASGNVDADYITDERAVLYPYGQGRVSGRVQVRTVVGQTKATMVELHAPPGVRVAAAGIGNGTARLSLYILGGGITRTAPQLSIVRGSFNTAYTLTAQVAALSIGRILDPAVRTLLANAARTDPVTKMSTRQIGALVDFYTLRQNGGTTEEANLPDPVEYSFDIAID